MPLSSASRPIAFLTLLLFLASVRSSHAQLTGAFDQAIQEIEARVEEPLPTNVELDYHASSRYNNHMEFGLSIDPNTSSLAGRENPQLKGWVQETGLNLHGQIPVSNQLSLRLQYLPTFENYAGEDGGLDVFDAFSDTFVTELEFLPRTSWPAFALTHQFHRLNREDDTYDSIQRRVGLRFGQFLEYGLGLRSFDDSQTLREDFLLVGSTSHMGRARFQLGLARSVLGKIEYTLERETFAENLNILVLGVAGLSEGEQRSDWRHLLSARLLEVATSRLLLQQEFSVLWNLSDADFYDFASVEVAASAFYQLREDRWARLRLSYLNVGFDGRRTRGDTLLGGGTNEMRQDEQLGLGFRTHWGLREHLSLVADYQFTRNSTNETADIFDFLNYTNSIASVAIQLSY